METVHLVRFASVTTGRAGALKKAPKGAKTVYVTQYT